MSHFIVATLHRHPDTLEDVLEPYYEGLAVDSYICQTKDESILYYRERFNDYHTSDEEVYLDTIDENLTYDADGNLLSTYNPDSKWDWWSLGGRWAGSLLIKKSVTDYYIGTQFGNTALVMPKAPRGYRWVDQAKLKDVEFAKMRTFGDSYNEALRFWEIVVEGKPLNPGEEAPHNNYKPSYYIDRYVTKERYAEYCCTFSAFALLIEDEGWYEEGSMWWFGMSSTTPASFEEYTKLFQEKLKDPKYQDYYISMVDCHI